MTSSIHDDAEVCSRKPVFVGGVTGFGEICTDVIRAAGERTEMKSTTRGRPGSELRQNRAWVHRTQIPRILLLSGKVGGRILRIVRDSMKVMDRSSWTYIILRVSQAGSTALY